MPRLPIKKKLTVCLSSLLVGCTPSAQPLPVCHQWNPQEKQQHYWDDISLSPDNSLHGIIRDYERICIVLS